MVIDASVPPQSATSAMPDRIIWKARPTAWVPEAQAETTPKAGPFRPRSIDTCDAAAFGIIFGTVKGCGLPPS